MRNEIFKFAHIELRGYLFANWIDPRPAPDAPVIDFNQHHSGGSVGEDPFQALIQC
ncbi:hypothetical protein [Lacisediminimonas profundi]|uniref:hypothetical protein n=1 Tax=Lacisediminimonas profundi TaxID=2603856 RepID=UPI00138719C9|nr:hypothetical protein [Lacisediminimonas profundi]